MPNPIIQEIIVGAEPADVYALLTDERKFAECTGAPATLGQEPGEPFTCFGGGIAGRQLELVDGKRLVQAWRSKDWPDGIYSIVRFDISKAGTGTEVTLLHDAFPESAREHLEAGWKQFYWEPMARYFAK